jgi:5-methylcytosine-specific restriction endonuclease McrA
MCWGCSRHEAVDLHHIVFKSRGGTDDVENLIPLCRICHDHNSNILNENRNKFQDIVKSKIKEFEDLGYLKEQFYE